MRNSRHGVGTFTASEKWRALIPTHPSSPPKRAIIYCHQNGANANSLNAGALYYEFAAERLRTHIVAGDFAGTSTWGNDASKDALGDMVDLLLASSTSGVANVNAGCLRSASDKVCLYGGSMGILPALNYMQENPSKVAVVVGVIPVIALDAAHDANPERFTNAAATIEAAYGGTAGYNAAIASHDPSQNTAAIAATGVPIHLWYSSTDTLVLPAEVEAFASAVGATCTLHSMGAVGHTFNYANLSEELANCFAAYV